MDGPVRLMREASARRAVLYQYANAHDRFVAKARAYVERRNYIAAAGMVAFADTVRRAYAAEAGDPEPRE